VTISDLLSTDIFTALIYIPRVVQWGQIYIKAFNSFMQAFTITLTPMEPLHQDEQNKTSVLELNEENQQMSRECAELGSHTCK